MGKEFVEAPGVKMGLSPEDKARFDAVRERAERLGVLDISFSGPNSVDGLECFEQALDVIEKNVETLDRNAEKAEA
jgi:hypothetical protein